MPRPFHRTQSHKRVYKAVPGGGTHIHYKLKVGTLPSCSICNKPLVGLSRLSTSKMRKLNQTKKRVERPYGGQICQNCLKNSLKQAVRTF